MGEERTHHRKKNILTRRSLMNISALLFAIAVIGKPFLVDRENTNLALEALKGNRIECANGVESVDPRYPFDAIVVPGAGIIGDNPSSFGKLRLEGAAYAYKLGLAPIIILNEGKMKPGEEQVDKNYLQKFYRELTGKDLSDDKIIIETKSINTATNKKETKKILLELGIRKVIDLTNEFHGKRSALHGCAWGIAVFPISVEDLIISQNPLRAQEIKTIYESDAMRMIKMKEYLELVEGIWDGRGFGPTIVSLLTK